MDLAGIITQLRTYATVFTHTGSDGVVSPQVAGANKWAEAVDDVWLAQPAAYVVPLSQDASSNTLLDGLQQVVTESVAVIVDFDNRVDGIDRRGQTVAETFDTIRASVFKALLNWRPDPDRYARGFAYVSGEPIEPFNKRRLTYQFTFAIEATITEQDGWQDPVGDSFGIEVDIINPETGAEIGTGFEVNMTETSP